MKPSTRVTLARVVVYGGPVTLILAALGTFLYVMPWWGGVTLLGMVVLLAAYDWGSTVLGMDE